MATLKDFQKVNDILPEDEFLVDASGVTKKISASDLTKELDRIYETVSEEKTIVGPDDDLQIMVDIEPSATSVEIPDAKYGQSDTVVYKSTPSISSKKITMKTAIKDLPIGELDTATTIDANDLLILGTADGNKKIKASEFTEKLRYDSLASIDTLQETDYVIVDRPFEKAKKLSIESLLLGLSNDLGGSGDSNYPFYDFIDSTSTDYRLKRAFYRGKNLGTSVTTEQYANIANGTFTGLFIGDYWEINGVVWRIVDINYYIGYVSCTGVECVTPHLNIMPDAGLMHGHFSTSYTDGYTTCSGWLANEGDVKTIVSDSFPKKHRMIIDSLYYTKYFNTSTKSLTFEEKETDIEIPNEMMIFGRLINRFLNIYLYSSYSDICCQQLAAMRLNPKLIAPIDGKTYWLRDKMYLLNWYSIYVNAKSDSVVDGTTGYNRWYRPVFSIK